MKWLTRRAGTNPPPPEAPKPELAATRRAEQLEAVMMELQKYGKPRLGISGLRGGWHCYVELSATSPGCSVKVRSEFNHAVPLDAALECRDRLHALLKSPGSL